MSETQQHTIFGEPIEEELRIETTGRVIRPWKRMIDQIASEYVIEATENGFAVDAVDSANVIAIFTELHSEAFEEYNLTESRRLGVSGQLGTVLQHARYGKSTNDDITITVGGETVESTVTREIGETAAEIGERATLVDPGSIREQPDAVDLDLDIRVSDLSPETVTETIGMLDTDGTHIKLTTTEDALVLSQEEDMSQRTIQLECEPTTEAAPTWFSGSYLEKAATALRNGYVDDVQLRWAEEYPLMIDFERDETYSGTIMIAPRLKPE